MKYYVELTQQIYDPEDPRTFKSVCIKCHTTRSPTNELINSNMLLNLVFVRLFVNTFALSSCICV